ncbi:MAG TPA: DUF4397 domain-containing protein [Thermomicrobiales bacterium]|nr:DUF4397 domain-containing protein [Thermomicrobiales bacterium]
MSVRHPRRSLMGNTLLLIVTILLAFTAPGAVAQEATPGSTDMGTCTTALGIGAEGDGCINVVHASPDAPNVDIYLDGELALSNLAFGWYGGWLAVPAGDHQVQVTAAGTAPDTAVIDATVTVEADRAYHIAATGFLAEIAPQIYEADLSPIADGSARVRAVHTVPDAPPVDVAVPGGDVLVSNLEFPNASAYLEVPAASYDLEVRLAGTTDVALPLPGVTLDAGTVYDVFAIGSAANGALAALIVPSPIVGGVVDAASTGCTAVLGIGAEGDACVDIVHASPDAPAVDVYVDGELALSNLAFGSFSGWVAVPAGEHQIQVTATGQAPDTAVIDANVALESGVAYQVAATGLLANITPQIVETDLSEVNVDSARVRVIHTSPDAPAVDIAVTGGDVLVAGLEFPNASDALEVPAGTYDLEVRPAGSTDVALALPGVQLDGGMVYDVFAIGQLGDGSLTVLVVPSMAAQPAG